MKIVIFGLAISSSWGNGHATLWRGLCSALAAQGHTVIFFERDVPYYASHRDLHDLPHGRLHLYTSWDAVAPIARCELDDADAAIVTSFCPDAGDAEALALDSPAAVRAFYDLDTPVTLERLEQGEPVAYIGPRGLAGYDVVLSYAGGVAASLLQSRLGACRVVPLYGSVDPAVHHPVPPLERFRCDLSYLGTYSPDRQEGVQTLFFDTAVSHPDRRFVLGGSQYPAAMAWPANVHFMRHVAPAEHAAFYCSSRITLNVTRRAMLASGDCPSGRLFEAAACGVPIATDAWPGLEQFFEPGDEILLVRTTDEVRGAIARTDEELQRIARRARERALDAHTAAHRAGELVDALTTKESLRDVGDHPGGGRGHAHPAARILEGTAAGWQPRGWNG